MYAVEKLSSYITRGVYTVSGPFHPFGGAVDIIVVQQHDGSFKSSPWYVRFGKFQGVLKTKEKVVNICVNGEEARFHMYLDHKGEAYFLRDPETEDGDFLMSPPSSGDETDVKIQSQKEAVAEMDMGNGKIVKRTSLRRSGILGLMFGRRSMRENGNDMNAQRASSLERAEIAADLLEMKWSTNLPPNNSSLKESCDRIGMDATPTDIKGSPQTPSSPEDLHRDDTTNSYGGATDDSFRSSTVSKEHFKEVAVHSSSSPRVDEEDLDVNTSEIGDLTDNIKLTPDQVTLGIDESDATLKESVLRNLIGHGSHGEGSDDNFGTDIVNGVPFEEMITHTLCLTTHEEDLDISNSGADDFAERSDVFFESATGSDNYDAPSEGSIRKNSTFNVQSPGSAVIFHVSIDKADETLNLSSGSGEQIEHSYDVLFETNELISEVKSRPESGACSDKENLDGIHYQNLVMYSVEDSSASGNPQVDSSVFYQGSETEELVQEREQSLESVEFLGNQLQMDEGESTRSSTHMETMKESLPSSECSEDDQFLFSFIDTFVDKAIDPDQSPKDATVRTDDHPSLTAESDGEEHEMKDMIDEQFFESISEVSRTQTSPMPIPRNWRSLPEPELLIRSLPIIRSHILDLESSDLHPISCSLNLKSTNSEPDLLEKEISGSSRLEAYSESNMIEDHCISETAGAAVVAENWREQKVTPISPVEFSLCKHLLFEGMGADAASQAFNTEKVNLEKFSALGPSIVKNERLVVRIGGRYFPWDAAAPIIMGMVSFGQENIFEPQGMIAVDRAVINHKGDATRAMVQSGGSWKLWPFTFRKSKTITTVRSAPAADLYTVSVTPKSKTTMKKVLSLTPTSEELASLNLKEGPNVITFTFSTAMLGKQQVDARIYLWKWNTRIVVSDVDGTITKSDVLGQFMPLVGIDWSQTGVAHLFSAIKENGYELLFLSARAISQAYLTRQFLFNLKQEGKALPDGPVVISPDGVFPSLYREVIRRAPHEFKIACLEDIRALFPPECNPFYAGFGNRDTDEISYLKVGIPKGKIFIINPKGQVAVNRRVDTKSYTSLHALVNDIFPPMSSAEQEDFNSWNYWKLPLLDVDI